MTEEKTKSIPRWTTRDQRELEERQRRREEFFATGNQAVCSVMTPCLEAAEIALEEDALRVLANKMMERADALIKVLLPFTESKR